MSVQIKEELHDPDHKPASGLQRKMITSAFPKDNRLTDNFFNRVSG